MKTRMQVTIKVVLLLFSLVFSLPSFSLPSIVQGSSHVGVTWGSTYHNTTFDPDPDWYSTYEAPAMNDTTKYIMNLIWTGQAGPNWIGNNFFGAMTTATNVYQVSDIIQGSADYDYLSTFHVGDMYPTIISGTRHYAYYGSQGADNGIIDTNLYPHTGWKHLFTFIYTCTNGGLIDIDGDGDYDFYGFVDMQNDTGIVGMPFAWTHTTDLSWDGYDDPDYSGYVYIGFENISKWMCDSSEFINYNYGEFVKRFYYYSMVYHSTINTALNWAMLDMTSGEENFGASGLYNGYWARNPAFDPSQNSTYPTNWEWWWSRMRVFGDGNMELPY